MARIQDYASLVQAIQDFSHRPDLAAYVDYYVQFAEARIYRDIFAQNMGDGIKAMEETIAGAMDPVLGTVSVPADFLALKTMQAQDGSSGIYTLDVKDAQWIYATYPIRQPMGFPAFVARDGANFVFGPFPDSSYTVSGTYWGQGQPLSASNTQSWMTTSCPDLLFAACMIEVQPFLKDSAAKADWESTYSQKLQSLILTDNAEKWGSATMQIEIA